FDDHVTLEGTTERFTDVQVFDNGVLLGPGMIQNEGQGGWLYEATNLTEGDHVFTARTTDDAGNQSALSAPVTVHVERPTLTIASGPPPVTNDLAPVFTSSSPDDSATFECRHVFPDGADETVPCESGFQLRDLIDGTHRLEITAISGGDTRGPAAVWTWTVDTVAPTAAEPDASTQGDAA